MFFPNIILKWINFEICKGGKFGVISIIVGDIELGSKKLDECVT